MPSVQLPWAAWFGDGSLQIELPEGWEVQICAMHDAPALPPAALQAACQRTIASPPLPVLAAGCRSAVIAVDDLSRPTPAALILPFFIEQLIAAGIPAEYITLVISLGSHTALTHEDLVKKLGAGVVARHRVINHDCHGELVDIGVSVGKVPVKLNAEFMAADLKILLGSVVPHAFAGFSGGAKMVLPGLSNIESIEWTHKAVMMGLRGKAGTLEGNRFRAEFERVARHAGVDFAIQVVVNSRREIAGIFAGDIKLAHREAAKFAGEIYATAAPQHADVAILNAYPKDDELLQAENALMYHHTAPEDYLKEDGVLLIASACSLGMGHHGLFGPNQRLYRKPMAKGFLKQRQLAGFMPGVTAEQFHQVYWEGYPHFDTWTATREYLVQRFPQGARVAVFPCSSIQIAAAELLPSTEQ